MTNINGATFNPKSATEILAREPQPLSWVWDKYIANFWGQCTALKWEVYLRSKNHVGRATFVRSERN